VEFIQTQIESVDQLRALLLLKADPKMEWDALTVAVKLYLKPEAAIVVLDALTAKGLLVRNGDPPHYRFEPKTPELASLIEQLAGLDRERPVTLLNMIYERPQALQAFADAFRLKKEKEN
jgi:hypothetical protein